jgi:hypothetical protein
VHHTVRQRQVTLLIPRKQPRLVHLDVATWVPPR